MILLPSQGRPLVTEEAPSGVLSLEFAFTAAKTRNILESWKPHLLPVFAINTFLDFFYIFFYGLFLRSAAIRLSRNSIHAFIKKTGKVLATLVGFAMAFDVIENVGMLMSAYYSVYQLVTIITGLLASFKFLFALSTLLFIIIRLFYSK